MILINKLVGLKKSISQSGSNFLSLGQEIVRGGIFELRSKAIDYLAGDNKELQKKVTKLRERKADPKTTDAKMSPTKQIAKNFINPDPNDDAERAKQKSMLSSQGIYDHSGTAYKGPGKPGETTNSNMWLRNFENHQGN